MKHWLTRLQMARELVTRANTLRQAVWAGVVEVHEAQRWLGEASVTIADLCRA